jgi:RNA binding exosome subunit
VKGPLHAIHARTFCHATEDLEKVKLAFSNVVGENTARTTRTEGLHGNPITILEATVEDAEGILGFFGKLGVDDLEEIIRTLDSRIDDWCNLFIRIDKQSALRGDVKLGTNADVISVRVRVKAFPSRAEVAAAAAKAFLSEEIARKKGQTGSI